METLNSSGSRRVPWNKGRLTGQKPPLKLREIWAIRTRLQISSNAREWAMFNLAIESKLRACDLTPCAIGRMAARRSGTVPRARARARRLALVFCRCDARRLLPRRDDVDFARIS